MKQHYTKPPFDVRLISDSGLSRIHEDSLRILEDIGARFPNPDFQSKLKQMGADVDERSDIVRFPRQMIANVLDQQRANNAAYYAEHEQPDPMDYQQRFFMSGGNNRYIIDPVSNTRRPGTLADVLSAIALGNQLPNVVRASGFVLPSEYPDVIADIIQFYLLSVFSSKRYFFTYIYSKSSAQCLIEMADVIAETSFDLLSGNLIEYELEPFRNLDFAAEDLAIAAEFTKRGIKTATTYWSWMGRNAPLDYAAMLSVTNANILAGLAAIIAMNPDNMFFRYIFPPHMANPDNPKMALMGNPNQIIFSWATRQLADFYGFPFTITNSGFSDSLEDNFQAGFEVGVSAALSVMAGIDSNGVKGVVGLDQGVSLDRLFTDHEFYRYLNYVFSRQIPVNDETLRFDEIKEAGIGGDFLYSLEDADQVEEFVFRSPAFFSGDYDQWKNGPTGTERVRQEVDARISANMPDKPVIDDAKIKALDKVFLRYVSDPEILKRLKRQVQGVTGVEL